MNRYRKVWLALALAVAVGIAAGGVARADQVQDATITAKIETAYLFNEHLNPFEIRTNTQDGTVTLTGSVESQIQKDLAERVAKTVTGVKQVVNNIQIGAQAGRAPRADQWTASVADASVTASVRTRLEGLRSLGTSQIQVDTQNSTVTLNGTVQTPEQRQRAENIARDTRGVRNVVNNLQVSGQAGAPAVAQAQQGAQPEMPQQQAAQEPQGAAQVAVPPDWAEQARTVMEEQLRRLQQEQQPAPGPQAGTQEPLPPMAQQREQEQTAFQGPSPDMPREQQPQQPFRPFADEERRIAFQQPSAGTTEAQTLAGIPPNWAEEARMVMEENLRQLSGQQPEGRQQTARRLPQGQETVQVPSQEDMREFRQEWAEQGRQEDEPGAWKRMREESPQQPQQQEPRQPEVAYVPEQPREQPQESREARVRDRRELTESQEDNRALLRKMREGGAEQLNEAEQRLQDRLNEAQRLRREAAERRQEVQQQIRERQQDFVEEQRGETDANVLAEAREDMLEDIARAQRRAEEEARDLERRAQVAEQKGRQEFAEARRETAAEVREVGERAERQPREDLGDRIAGATDTARERAGEAQETVSDEWIEKRIEVDLMLSRNVSMGDLDVEVNNGVATLTGTVDSPRQKRIAEQIANDIDGVRQVRNNITVAPDDQG